MVVFQWEGFDLKSFCNATSVPLSLYICSGQFLTTLRSHHVSIQHQTGERHVTASRTSKQEFSIDSNPERIM